MTYGKYTFFLLLLTFIFLEFFASGWYTSILPETKPHEFLIPMLVSLWILLQIQAKVLIEEKRWLVIAKMGLISGTICGFLSWSIVLFRNTEFLMKILENSFQFGFYALYIFFAFQLILGAWLIGLTSYFAVKEGCIVLHVHN